MTAKTLLIVCLFGLSSGMTATPDISVVINRFAGTAGPYMEMSLYVVGASLTCDSSLHDSHGIDYVIMIRDAAGQIVHGQKYRLSNQACPARDLIDVRRFPLDPGHYKIEMEVTDIHDSLNTLGLTLEEDIHPLKAGASLSDIQLLSALRKESDPASPLNKSGLYMEPLAFQFYYPALDRLQVYLEAYHTDQLPGQPYMEYTIKPAKGDIPLPLVAYKKVPKDSITANVYQLDISTLISGTYILEAGLYDGEKNPVDIQKAYFTRANPRGDSIFAETAMQNLEMGFVKSIPEDSLDYVLKAMAPVLQSLDVEVLNVLLKQGQSKAKRYFIHRYWTNQAGNYAGPAYHAYMKVAKVVDATYRSGFGYGFETDRGHIFLKYGKPDDVIEVEDEPSAPPYEIWFYNSFPATHQANVRFLFYNPSLARNAFTLLHSTAIGEVKNERWEVELYRDATLETPGVNDRVMGDNVHRNARKYFENY